MIDWQPYFAWLPVTVDAYYNDEIKNGKFSYLKWGWVERCSYTYSDDAGEENIKYWRYRLIRKDRSNG